MGEKSSHWFAAAATGDTAYIRAALAQGQDVNAFNDEDGMAALHLATNPDTVHALLEAGANPNLIDENSEERLVSILHWRADMDPSDPFAKDCEAIALDLISHGANVNTGGWDGLYPIHLAEDPAVITALCAAGADPNERNDEGRTPLFLVETVAAAQALIDAGADPTIKDGYDHYAWENANSEEVGALVEQAAKRPKREALLDIADATRPQDSDLASPEQALARRSSSRRM